MASGSTLIRSPRALTDICIAHNWTFATRAVSLASATDEGQCPCCKSTMTCTPAPHAALTPANWDLDTGSPWLPSAVGSEAFIWRPHMNNLCM